MGDTHAFAADVVRIVCDRLAGKAAEVEDLVAAGAPFGGWLEAEAYLACRAEQPARGFCEVAFRPTYGSEGVVSPERVRVT